MSENINAPVVVSYVSFTTAEDFENWQKESQRKIITVQPLITSLQGQFAENTQENSSEVSNDIAASLQVSVFVTYFKPI
jgi:hypothetical protein